MALPNTLPSSSSSSNVSLPKGAQTLRALVAATALSALAPTGQAEPVTLTEIDPNNLELSLSTFGYVRETNGPGFLNNVSDMTYYLSDNVNPNYGIGTTTLRPIDTWNQPGYDFIVQAINKSTGAVMDLGADFMNFRWFNEEEGTFQFNDNAGNTHNGYFDREFRFLRLEGVADEFTHFELVRDDSPAANIPEPGSLLLAIPGIAGVFALRRRRNEAKK